MGKAEVSPGSALAMTYFHRPTGNGHGTLNKVDICLQSALLAVTHSTAHT